MPIICSWCEPERKKKGLGPKVLGYKKIDIPPGHRPVAHSICEECEQKMMGGIPKAIKRDVERIRRRLS